MSEEGDKHKGLKIGAKFREVELRGRKRECFGWLSNLFYRNK